MFRSWFSVAAVPIIAAAVVVMSANTSQADSRGRGWSGGRGWGGYGGYGGYGYGPGITIGRGGVGISLGYGYPGYYGGGYGYGNYPSRGYYNYGYAPSYGYSYAPSYGYTPSYSYGTNIDTYSVPQYYAAPASEYSSAYPADTTDARREDPNAVTLNVRVPPNAEIWVDGDKTSQKGSLRQFTSPPLTPGQNYNYEVRARWTENGREVNQVRNVPVHAGDRLTVDFLNAPRGEQLSTPPSRRLEDTRPATPRTDVAPVAPPTADRVPPAPEDDTVPATPAPRRDVTPSTPDRDTGTAPSSESRGDSNSRPFNPQSGFPTTPRKPIP